MLPFCGSLGALDEGAANRVAGPTRARVQHHPHTVALIEAQLDEVVPGSEGAERVDVVRASETRGGLCDCLEARGEVFPGCQSGIGRGTPCPPIFRLSTLRPSMGYSPLDGSPHLPEGVWKVCGGHRGLRGDHSAADVDADGRGNDGAGGRDHTADGRSPADVYVRHGGDPRKDDGKPGHVVDLLDRRGVDGDALGPHLDRPALSWRARLPGVP